MNRVTIYKNKKQYIEKTPILRDMGACLKNMWDYKQKPKFG